MFGPEARTRFASYVNCGRFPGTGIPETSCSAHYLHLRATSDSVHTAMTAGSSSHGSAILPAQ